MNRALSHSARPALKAPRKSQRRREVRTELVILLRPVVIDNDEQWKQLASEPIDRAAALDPKAAAGVR
jgi:type II secretory pathway component GspD/PulD (secretin)